MRASCESHPVPHSIESGDTKPAYTALPGRQEHQATYQNDVDTCKIHPCRLMVVVYIEVTAETMVDFVLPQARTAEISLMRSQHSTTRSAATSMAGAHHLRANLRPLWALVILSRAQATYQKRKSSRAQSRPGGSSGEISGDAHRPSLRLHCIRATLPGAP